jgi:hypothetical protein
MSTGAPWRYRATRRLVRHASATDVSTAASTEMPRTPYPSKQREAASSIPVRSMTPALMTTTPSSGGCSRRVASGWTMARL